jgi:hypothetical protein
MIVIGDKLVSENLMRVHFACDLEACKGACCIEGDLGAPLEEAETVILEQIYPLVQPYLTAKSQKAIRNQGKFVRPKIAAHPTTPLVKGRECAYVVMQEGKALCGIEMAYRDGKIDFPKPISCHLYPVRINRLDQVDVDAVNYEEWHICADACKLGKEIKLPLYKFLKAPLTRKYGEEFYKQMADIFGSLEQSGWTGKSV